MLRLLCTTVTSGFRLRGPPMAAGTTRMTRMGPKHGEKPAELVRTKAEAVLAVLSEPSVA